MSDLAGDDPLDPESGTNSGSSSEEFISKFQLKKICESKLKHLKSTIF